jgi:maleylacetate reductase
MAGDTIAFTLEPSPIRVVFGAGRADDVAAEVERLGCGRVLVCTSRGGQARARPILDALADLRVGVFDGVEPHCPEPVVRAALARFLELEADGVVALGGGSAVGTGKFIRAETGKPLVMLPTTYSGSEQTPILGMKVGEEKRTRIDPGCMPSTVVYDPLLTLGLSAHDTATIGMNSLAHCVEALYPKEPNAVAALLAEEGIRRHARGLARSVAAPDDLGARTEALYGGYLGGVVIRLTGLAIHHRICHVLGGHYGIPHGDSNSVILPQATAYNAAAAPRAMAAVRRALGVDDAASGLFDLATRMGAPTDLKSLGMPEDDIPACAEETVRTLKHNPRPADAASVTRLLENAWRGRRPSERSDF